LDYVVSTDTGGTFVDAIVINSEGRMAVGKHASTPQEPARGILGAAGVASENLGLPLKGMLPHCRMFFNGTTVTTNAMIQRLGARTGLLITRGFEDTLMIGRIKARTAGLNEIEITNYQHAEKPAPVVPIELTRGVRERVDFQGKVLCPLDEDDVIAALDSLVAQKIEALAICLLWSFKNPAHEQRIKQIAQERNPELFITASSDLVPLMREYERANTTAINCFLGPTLDHYLNDIDRALNAENYGKGFLVMQSVGGLSPAAEIRRTPITTLLSGPVGGVIATQQLGRLIGEENLISTDMGGTSFDVGLIVEGAPQSTPITVMERNIVMYPAIDIITVGAGGGSRIWLDDAVTLKVGPMSQGSMPGPACYDRGGTEPSVTDADVILGYINPDYFLGGTMKLDAAKSREVLIKSICEPLGMMLEDAAWGAYEIVNGHMADLVRQASVERGHDPRDFVLLAFGGCGPTHCTGYGPDIGVKSIIVPPTAPVFSALGIAQSDLKHFFSRSLLIRLARNEPAPDSDLGSLSETFSDLNARARAQLHLEGIADQDMLLITSLDMRYRGQVHEMVVPIEFKAAVTTQSLYVAQTAFIKQYEKTYGAGSSSELSDIECVSCRVDAITSPIAKLIAAKATIDEKITEPIGDRKVYWGQGEWHVTPVYRGDQLPTDATIEGPAIIEFYATTIPLHAGQSLRVDEHLNMIIKVGV
jgi:N-methylhydantoinase A